MAYLVILLAILILVIIFLIAKEIGFLKRELSKKTISKPKPRLVVPSPSIVKETISKERPKFTSWLHNISSRISDIDLTRNVVKTRLFTKQATAEAERESEENKRKKLRSKIEELEKKMVKETAKPIENTKTSAIELARETTELSNIEEEKEIIEPEIVKPFTLNDEIERLNAHLVSVHNKINNNELHEAKELYKELVEIYNGIVDKIENKKEVYDAVKEAHNRLTTAIEESE